MTKSRSYPKPKQARKRASAGPSSAARQRAADLNRQRWQNILARISVIETRLGIVDDKILADMADEEWHSEN